MGSNLGDRDENIRRGLDDLTASGEVRVRRASKLYATAPVDLLAQPEFLNNVVEIETDLSAEQLQQRTQTVEQRFRDQPKIPKGPRALDIDILLYHDQVSADPRLTIPHPAMCARRFVLVPLLEISPDLWCVRDDRRYSECLAQLDDRAQRVDEYHG